MLVSAIHQHESALGIHMSPPSWTSHLSLLPTLLGCHRALVWAPWVIQKVPSGYRFYMRWCICFHVASSIRPILSFPTLCSHVSSLCLCLHCCSANSFISTIFLDSMYMLSYMVFACFWLTSLCVTGSSFIPLDSKEIQPVHPKEKWSRSVVYDSFRPHGW